LFAYPLDQHLNLKHSLIQLSALIDWTEIDKTFFGHFVTDHGSPAWPPLLVAGLRRVANKESSKFNCILTMSINTYLAMTVYICVLSAISIVTKNPNMQMLFDPIDDHLAW
jgi:hypothetical protein